MMDKQIKLYSVDTKAFYTDKEQYIHNKKMYINKKINNIEKGLKKSSVEFVKNHKSELNLEKQGEEDIISQIFNSLVKRNKKLKRYKNIKLVLSEQFTEEINNFIGVRKLDKKYLNPKNEIGLFVSSLSRTMGLEVNDITNNILILRPYHYVILNQLMINDYEYENEKYIFLTASAGQIRTKKCVFIKKRVWEKHEKTFLCGLTIKDINESKEKGMNLTKFMAYLALNNSATDEWTGFDIDRTIVVNDFETEVTGLVDHIDIEKLSDENIEDCIERKTMKVPIEHSDGCGLILPTLSKKNFMVRLPWMKGLLTPCDYMKYCKQERKKLVDGEWVEDKENYKITDMYGVEHDILEENIQVIFTKSQFKAYKYYENELDENGNLIISGWDKYKSCFKEYGCSANKCNEEPNTSEFRQASLNYQMLQTLTDITEEEIQHFTNPIREYLIKAYTDLKTQLDILKATPHNKYKNNLQKALTIYPEMLQESYCKKQLSDIINKKKKQGKFGKFKIDATYTFLIPDVYAWMEFMFSGDKSPKGLLENNKVSCKLAKEVEDVVVNRSPHLYRELGVRHNIINKETKKWFITNGCYTSSHDLISKLLQFDM